MKFDFPNEWMIPDTVEWGESDRFWKSNLNTAKSTVSTEILIKPKRGLYLALFILFIGGINEWETRKFNLQDVAKPIRPTGGVYRTGGKNEHILFAIKAVYNGCVSIEGNVI